MRRTGLIALTALFLAGGVQAAGATAPANDYFEYRASPGDTLTGIATQYLQSERDWITLQKLNNVPDPRRLQPDQRLLIPKALLKQTPMDATVAAMTGSATVTLDDRVRPLRKDMPIREGATLKTDRNSYLSLMLHDGSRISLPSNSTMKVALLRRVDLTGVMMTRFDLVQGRVESQVTPRSPGSLFEVRTPLSTAGVRGTHFRVGIADDGLSSHTEVLSGAVAVRGSADTSDVVIEGGTGLVTDSRGRAIAQIRLLPAPALANAETLQTARIVDLKFERVSGARDYVIQLSRDAGFSDVLAEHAGTEPNARIEGLPDGIYFARAIARDGNGLMGLTRTYAFTRAFNTLDVNTPTRADPASGNYHFTWTGRPDAEYQFVLSRDRDFSQVVVDMKRIHYPALAVANLPSGIYYWRVKSTLTIQGQRVDTYSATQQLEVVTSVSPTRTR